MEGQENKRKGTEYATDKALCNTNNEEETTVYFRHMIRDNIQGILVDGQIDWKRCRG